MTDWRAYFKTRLTSTGQFTFECENHKGQTDSLIFKSSDKNNLTTFQIGILGNGALIYFQIHNPLTPGFSEQQRREFFYKYNFHPTESYGPPGLEFTQMNIDHFDKFLKGGLKGKEIQYFKGDKLVKSEVFQVYAESDVSDFMTTIEFDKRGLWKRIAELFKSRDDRFDYMKEIELKEVFNGIK